jgi:hypothetical protein
MNPSAELLALQKDVLLARSSLCRLKIRRDVARVRESVSIGHVGTAIAGSAPARELLLGLLFSGIGGRRVSRVIAFASRALVIARVALAAFGMLRSAPQAAPAPEASPAPQAD